MLEQPLVVNGGKRSKTGRKKKLNGSRSSAKKPGHDHHGSANRAGDHDHPGSDVKPGHNHLGSDVKPGHDHLGSEDVLWRETVWSLKFRQTSPRPIVDSERTTQTPLSDLSPFLLPPALEREEITDIRHDSHQTSKKSHERDGSRGAEEQSLKARRPSKKG